MLKPVSAKKKSTACWKCFYKKREGCLYVNGGIVNVVGDVSEDHHRTDEPSSPEHAGGDIHHKASNAKEKEKVKGQPTARIIKKAEVERAAAKGSA
jgi:hypothetical protein